MKKVKADRPAIQIENGRYTQDPINVKIQRTMRALMSRPELSASMREKLHSRLTRLQGERTWLQNQAI